MGNVMAATPNPPTPMSSVPPPPTDVGKEDSGPITGEPDNPGPMEELNKKCKGKKKALYCNSAKYKV